MFSYKASELLHRLKTTLPRYVASIRPPDAYNPPYQSYYHILIIVSNSMIWAGKLPRHPRNIDQLIRYQCAYIDQCLVWVRFFIWKYPTPMSPRPTLTLLDRQRLCIYLQNRDLNAILKNSQYTIELWYLIDTLFLLEPNHFYLWRTVVLQIFMGWSINEIAFRYDLPVPVVRGWYKSSLKRLWQEMGCP